MNLPARLSQVDSDPADALGAFIPGSLGRRAFIAGSAGAVVGATVLASTASAVEPGASYFESLAPTRLCDTRKGTGYTSLGNNTIRVKIAGNGLVPSDAVAAVLTVTAVNRTGNRTWVSAYPAGAAFRETSSLNLAYFDERVANLVTVKLGVDGSVDIRSLRQTEIIVDVAGVYRPTSSAVSAGRFVPLPAVRRVLDTRTTPGKPGRGSVVTVNLNGTVPGDAIAVVANLTGVEATRRGFLSTYPLGGSRPESSNLNMAAGQNRAVGIMTKLGTAGGIRGFNVFSLSGAHVVVDVAGYISGSVTTPSGAGLFVPIRPVRMLDTRIDKRRLWPGWTRSFTLPSTMSSKASAVATNLTVTETMNRGYFSMFAAQTVRRESSTLNAGGPGQTLANHAISAVTSKGVAIYSLKGGHVICDVTGWFTGSPGRATTGVPVNPPPPPGPLPWSLSVPKMGLANGVYAGASKAIVDTGNTWHWTGTGLVGQGAHSAVFGHRTEHGGPYRYQHYLGVGDLLYVTTFDNRRYTYQMASEYITSKFSSQILAATRQIGGETFSLVACSRTNRLPTDLDYRIVSTFKLVEWVDLG
jgi:LPXTG-site transpeptidase (sortase) family protein